MVLPYQENSSSVGACLAAFYATAPLVGFRTDPTAGPAVRAYHYNAGVLYGPDTPEGYWHELAHFMVAPFNRRYSPDYGLGPSPMGGTVDFSPRVSEAVASGEEALACYLQYLWVEHVDKDGRYAAHVAETFVGCPGGKSPWDTPEGQRALAWFDRHGYRLRGKPVARVRPTGVRSPRFAPP